MKNQTIVLKCIQCEKDFERRIHDHNYNLKKGRKIFCSLQCSNEYSKLDRSLRMQNMPHVPHPPHYQDPIVSAFKFILTKARKRLKGGITIELRLTVQDLQNQWEIQNHKCTYSGVELQLPSYSHINDPIYTASLDRINSHLGYIKGNIQFVSTIINRAKHELSHDRMLEFCDIMKKMNNQ